MQPELELCDYAEIPAAPADCPEQVGVSSGPARTIRPLARTTSAESRLSIESPACRFSQPCPPPRVRPPTRVWLTMPAGTARPCACVAASRLANSAPPWTRAVLASGSTTTPLSGLKSMTRPSSQTDVPGRCVRRREPRPQVPSPEPYQAPSRHPQLKRSEQSPPVADQCRRSTSCGPRRSPDPRK